MNKIIASFLKALKTPQIVALYNLANPEAPVKKFTDRATAERRMFKTMEVDPKYCYKRLALPALKLGIMLPVPDGVLPVTLPKPPAITVAAPVVEMPAAPAVAEEPLPPLPVNSKKKPQVTTPHLNLRCPVCGYYAKTTMVWLARGRLVCPVDPKHGRLLTADERGERRGR